jgi:hypothetical protein
MEKVTEMRTGKRGRIGTKRGGGLPRLWGFILGFFRRQRDNLTRNRRRQAVVFEKSEEGKWRGGVGGIEGVDAEAVSISGGVGDGRRGCGISASNGSGVLGGSDQWVPHVRGKEGGCAAGLAGLVCWAALGQDWPSRAVSFIYIYILILS